MYNPSLGRFNTIDPYSQFNSPYLAMANNPISYVDPDGGRALLNEYQKEKLLNNFLLRGLRGEYYGRPLELLRHYESITGDLYMGFSASDAYAHGVKYGYSSMLYFFNLYSNLNASGAPSSHFHDGNLMSAGAGKHDDAFRGTDAISVDGLQLTVSEMNRIYKNAGFLAAIDPFTSSFGALTDAQVHQYQINSGLSYDVETGEYGHWEDSYAITGEAGYDHEAKVYSSSPTVESISTWKGENKPEIHRLKGQLRDLQINEEGSYWNAEYSGKPVPGNIESVPIIFDILSGGAGGLLRTGTSTLGKVAARKAAVKYAKTNAPKALNSIGAAARGWKNVKLINNNLLKKHGIDAHALKREFLGNNAKIAQFDLYRHTDTGEILIFGKGGNGTPWFTGEFINF